MKYQLKYFLASVFLLGAIFSASAQTQPWIAPQGWAVKKNPIVGNAASIQAGKNTYRNLCIACHGESGKGNGSLAINFTPRPADHTSKKVQQQKDGELFYKIITGRNAMPNFRATFSDNDIWNVINFIRTLAPAELSAPPKPVVKTVSVAPTASTVVTSQKKNTQQNILPNNNTKTVSPSDTNKHTSLVKTDSIAHQLNTAELKMNTPPAIDNTIKSVTTKQDSVIPETSAQIPDSTAQTNSSEGDSEERRKFLFTGSADVDVNVDGKKFNSSGIALEFMPILLWKPSKNLLFESHFHIMAGSGVLQTNTSGSGNSMAGMIMRLAATPSVNHSMTTSTSAPAATTSSSSSMASIMLAYADLVYFVNPYLSLTGGMFLSPFGMYPERLHAPWMNRLPDAPAGMGNDMVLPETELGMQARGGIPIWKCKINYSFYVSNGPSLVDDTSKNAGRLSFDNLVDNNKNKALGGRLGLMPIPDNPALEIGFYGQEGRVGNDFTPHAGVQAYLFGSDVMYHQYFKEIKGTIHIVGQHSFTTVDKVYYKADPSKITNVPAEDVNLNDSTYRYTNTTQLYFIIASYRPTAAQNFLKNTEYIFRYDYLKEPTFARWNNSGKRLTFGLEYWLDSRSAMKLAYMISIPDNIFTKNSNMLMYQWVIAF